MFAIGAGIAIVAIVMGAVVKIVQISIRHAENIERMKHGYPLLNGDKPTQEPYKIIDAKEVSYEYDKIKIQ
ncbi:MAG: hypothetical protein LBM16_03795 [Clostridiales bacterium]|nr:hypothetical protein [Clostridiales bacterium]